jgi:hypothetical protein
MLEVSPKAPQTYDLRSRFAEGLGVQYRTSADKTGEHSEGSTGN